MKFTSGPKPKKKGIFESKSKWYDTHLRSDIFNHRRIFCLHPSPLEFSAFVDWDLFENLVTWNKKNKALLQSKCITCFRYHSLQSQWPGKLPIFRCTASSSNINLHVPRASWGDEIHIYRHTERSNFLRYCSQKEATRERAKSQVAVSCSLGCPKGCMFYKKSTTGLFKKAC